MTKSAKKLRPAFIKYLIERNYEPQLSEIISVPQSQDELSCTPDYLHSINCECGLEQTLRRTTVSRYRV